MSDYRRRESPRRYPLDRSPGRRNQGDFENRRYGDERYERYDNYEKYSPRRDENGRNGRTSRDANGRNARDDGRYGRDDGRNGRDDGRNGRDDGRNARSDGRNAREEGRTPRDARVKTARDISRDPTEKIPRRVEPLRLTTREDPEKKYEQFAAEITEKVARNHLRTMLCKKNHELLEKSVQRFNAEAGEPEDKYELSDRAEEELAYLSLRDELYTAMDTTDLDKLIEICQRVEQPAYRRYKNPLTPYLMHARKLISILNRTVDLPSNLEFDDKTMRELAQFSNPPKVVHDIVKSCFLLLGEYEGHANEWAFCRDLLRPYKSTGKGGLRYRIENFDPAKVDPELAGRSKQIIDAYKIVNVFRVSECAASLYVWTKSKLDKVQVGQPADLKRQREILGVDMPLEKWRPKNSYY